MTRLVRTRGRLIAVLIIIVASLLLIWVLSVVLGSHRRGDVRPGIDFTTPIPAPTDTATSVAPESTTPVEQETGAPVEAPVVNDPQVPEVPVAPASPADDDDDDDYDHDDDNDHVNVNDNDKDKDKDKDKDDDND